MRNKEESKISIIIFIIGILIYPLGLWWTIIPTNVLNSLNLESIGLHCGLIAYATAIAFFVVSIVYRPKNKRKIIHWIGFGLHSLYIIAPIILLILIFVMVAFFGANV